MTIRNVVFASPENGEMDRPICRFCGQALGDAKVLARYEKNVRSHDAQVVASLREEARAEVEAEYAKKEHRMLAGLKVKAEEKVQKNYDRRLRQMEQSNQSLQRELDASKRRLEHLSSANRGAFNEEDLVAALNREFPADRIERVKRGPAGRGDILHEVRCGVGASTVAGYIVYECKDTARWDNDFLTQVKAAQQYHRASHAVIVSNAFPAKYRGFSVIGGVIIVDATGMVAIARILRTSIQQLAEAGLSADGRKAKSEALLSYLASQAFADTFGAVREATEKAMDALAKERRQHDQTWVQREGFYRRIDAGLVEIYESIFAIIEDRAARELVAAAKNIELLVVPATH
jgi:hypothetical protein